MIIPYLIFPLPSPPSSWGGLGLSNNGEHLLLKDEEGVIIDQVDCSGGWFAGDRTVKASMERVDPWQFGSIADNWETNTGSLITGLDAEGGSLLGTPLAQNGAYLQEEEEFSFTPAPSPTLIVSPTLTAVSTSSEVEQDESVFRNVIISEFMPCPEVGDSEWVELYNGNPFPIELLNWLIDDVEGASDPVSLPSPLGLPMYGYVLWRGSSPIFNNTGGDQVRLLDSTGKLVDSYSYGSCEPAVSWARGGEGESSVWYQTETPTPGESNQISFLSNGQESQESVVTTTLVPQVSERPSLFRSEVLEKPSSVLGEQAGSAAQDSEKLSFIPPQLGGVSSSGSNYASEGAHDSIDDTRLSLVSGEEVNGSGILWWVLGGGLAVVFLLVFFFRRKLVKLSRGLWHSSIPK